MINCKGAFITSDTPKILILGTMPGKKSLESEFYYTNKSNRFWDILAKVFNETKPITVTEKKEFLKEHDISLWDVIKSCEREGSLDKNIENIEINTDIRNINAQHIFCNGGTAYELFTKNFPDLKATLLTSSSQAAGWKKDLTDLKGWEKLNY